MNTCQDLKKKQVIETTWLRYYNKTLFTQGIIGREEYDKIEDMIYSRSQTEE